jgi:hypothetical protein
MSTTAAFTGKTLPKPERDHADGPAGARSSGAAGSIALASRIRLPAVPGQAQTDGVQSSQRMLIDRRRDTQRCADSDPGGLVDVHRQRSPTAEHDPARPYVNRLHARATFRPARQLMFVTRSLVLCTAVSPGPLGGTQVRPTEDCPAVPEPQAPANPSSVNATTTRYLRMCILLSPLGDV